jgi:hypothetical protein
VAAGHFRGQDGQRLGARIIRDNAVNFFKLSSPLEKPSVDDQLLGLSGGSVLERVVNSGHFRETFAEAGRRL